MNASLVKQHWRQALKKLRSEQAETVIHSASEEICQKIMNLNCFKQTKRIALYKAANKEPCLNNLEIFAHHHQKIIYYPRITSFKPAQLEFVEIRQGTEWKTNKWGISEPQGQNIISPEELNIVFVPLLGFDAYGNRLGMGAGFYDSTFSFIINAKQGKQNYPKLIGVAFEFQYIAEKILADPWDIPLEAVITESHSYFFNEVMQ